MRKTFVRGLAALPILIFAALSVSTPTQAQSGCVEVIPDNACGSHDCTAYRAVNYCGHKLHIKLCLEKTNGRMICAQNTVAPGGHILQYTPTGTGRYSLEVR